MLYKTETCVSHFQLAIQKEIISQTNPFYKNGCITKLQKYKMGYRQGSCVQKLHKFIQRMKSQRANVSQNSDLASFVSSVMHNLQSTRKTNFVKIMRLGI